MRLWDTGSRGSASTGLPQGLAQVGGSRSDLRGLAETASSLNRLMDLSPRTPTADELEGILEACR